MLKGSTVRQVSAILVFVVALAIVAGCAPAPTPVPPTPVPPTAVPATKAPAATQPAAATQPPAATAASATKAPAATVAPTSAPAASGSGKKLRIAMVMPGSIKDNGWNQSCYEAAMAAKTKYNVDVSFQESVQAAQAVDALRNYAADGVDLVIGADLYFTDPVNKVAPDFPKVMFGIAGGTDAKSKNVVAISSSNWEGPYLAAVLAGLLTKSGKVGILTATDSPVSKKMVNGFKTGATLYNTKVEVIHAFTGSWSDVVKGKELVKSMITQGADVVFTNSGEVNTGAIQAAQEGKIMAIGSVNDLYAVAPDTVVSSAIASPGAYVDLLIKWTTQGTFANNGGKALYLGVKDGIEDLAPFHNFDSKISQDIKDKYQKARQDLIDGKVKEPTAN
jgi:basic membrane protein A and related proteins